MNTAKYISELLTEHDCVIVPGLGGFVATRRHSDIHVATQSITPPAKKLSFNRMLVTNDGLLAKHLAENIGVGYSDAEREITQFVKQCNKQLEREGVVHIPDVGKLYINNAGQLGFAETPGKNLLADSFGLSPVHYTETFNKLDSATVDKKVAADVALKKPLNKSERSVGYWLQLAATLAIIATLSIFMTRDMYMEQLTLQNLGLVNFSSLFTEDVEVASTLEPVEIRKTTETNSAPAELPVVVDEDIPLVSVMEQETGYYMVWASFSDKTNAEKYIQRKGQANLQMMPSAEGYYRVVQFATTQNKQAELLINSYRNQQSSIWLLYNMH